MKKQEGRTLLIPILAQLVQVLVYILVKKSQTQVFQSL